MKLLEYTIFLLLLHTVVSNMTFIKERSTTTLHPPLERMLSRKKRVLLMPKGANLKFTTQLSKRMLSAFPRGFNFVIEVAFYYPTPGARIDLIPKRLRKPTTTTPKPKGTKPPIFVCIPGSLICYKAKPAAKPMKVQRIDENATDIQWVDTKKPNGQYYSKYENYGQQYVNPQKLSQWTNYGHQQHQYQKYNWMPTQLQQKYYKNWQPRPQTPQPYWSKWTTATPQNQRQNHWWTTNSTNYNRWMRPRLQQYQTQVRQQRWRRTLTLTHHYLPSYNTEQTNEDPHDSLYKYDPIHFPDLEPFYDWHQYHSHRDRRQLFHQFEGLSQILGINMKSCIIRAICESKRYLLPQGYSMIHDILRLIFTLPTIDGLTDDYSRAMKADYDTCDKFLRPKCAFNILDWFISSKKHFV